MGDGSGKLPIKRPDPISPGKVRTDSKQPDPEVNRVLKLQKAAITSQLRRNAAIQRWKKYRGLSRNNPPNSPILPNSIENEKLDAVSEKLSQTLSEKLNPNVPQSDNFCHHTQRQNEKVNDNATLSEKNNTVQGDNFCHSSHLTDYERQVIEDSARSIAYFGAIFLPHHLTSGYCQLHHDIYSLLYGLLSNKYNDNATLSIVGPGSEEVGGGDARHASSYVNLEIPTNLGKKVDNDAEVKVELSNDNHIKVSSVQGVENETYSTGNTPGTNITVEKPICFTETSEMTSESKETLEPSGEVSSFLSLDVDNRKIEDIVSEGGINKPLIEDVEYFRRWRKAVIAGPRGHAKTTSLMVFMLWCVCFQMRKYILLVSDTEDQCKMHLDSIKAELEVNERIRRCFGDLVGGVWGAEAIETSNGVRIQCRGTSQKVRGLKFRSKRPDLVVCDDLLNEDLCETEDRRIKIKKWFMGSLLRCMSKDGAIVVLGTILHEADLLSDLLRAEAGWVKRRYEACVLDEDRHLEEPTLWPDLYTLEDLEAMREEYASEGEISLFYREMFNRIVSNEASPFKREWFKYVTYKELEDKNLTNFVMVDPAYTLKKSADFCAFDVVGVSPDRKWYVKACIRGHWNVNGVINQWFEVVKTYHPLIVGVQTVDWNRVFKPLIEDEMRRRNLFHTVKEVQTYSPVSKGLSNKINRINRLSKYYANGTIIHVSDGLNIKELEHELLSHPHSKRDDLMDALSIGIDIIFPPHEERKSEIPKFMLDLQAGVDSNNVGGYE